MKSTVILPIFSNDSEAIRSIVSILNSTVKPSNLCIISNSKLSENRLASINAMFKSCCDGGEYSEELLIDKTVIKKRSPDFNMYNIVLNHDIDKHPNYYAINYLYDSTDVFLTLMEGSVYQPEMIGKMLDKMSDPNVGAVYSDYISRGRYMYLSTLHLMIKTSIPIGEIAFKKSFIEKGSTKIQNGEIINDIYSKAVVSHIPEPLFVA